jgi:hypothetical protein
VPTAIRVKYTNGSMSPWSHLSGPLSPQFLQFSSGYILLNETYTAADQLKIQFEFNHELSSTKTKAVLTERTRLENCLRSGCCFTSQMRS